MWKQPHLFKPPSQPTDGLIWCVALSQRGYGKPDKGALADVLHFASRGTRTPNIPWWTFGSGLLGLRFGRFPCNTR